MRPTGRALVRRFWANCFCKMQQTWGITFRMNDFCKKEFGILCSLHSRFVSLEQNKRIVCSGCRTWQFYSKGWKSEYYFLFFKILVLRFKVLILVLIFRSNGIDPGLQVLVFVVRPKILVFCYSRQSEHIAQRSSSQMKHTSHAVFNEVLVI